MVSDQHCYVKQFFPLHLKHTRTFSGFTGRSQDLAEIRVARLSLDTGNPLLPHTLPKPLDQLLNLLLAKAGRQVKFFPV